ncbi:Histone H1 [Neolecta irregularis DAH-3]|uniref:Histone H1 n=1 Tax=Neolecta irregularis (strain DAH-3) TaxID=1198029 RepID=A0A1U7LJI1_NEOID|nr:Histone H1 [Neolecta irregularis DAH-3]|eukprot:OLL22681.1 Histone H1 [Neolecta irregularis DAH-3]
MPPKKSPKSIKKATSQADHPAWKDMVAQGIQQLKERHGSSRPALKKFIASNFKINPDSLDVQFNMAIRRGVAHGLFVFPKGPSGAVKLAKKETAGSAEKKTVVDKKPASKKTPPTKIPSTKTTTKNPVAKKAIVSRKAPTAKKPVAKKPGAMNTPTKKSGTMHKMAESTPVVKTKSGRVSKPAVISQKKSATSAKKPSPRKSPKKA